MVNPTQLQMLYNKLYALLREYTWSLPTIEAIANLELAIYQAIPCLSDVKTKLYRLQSEVRHTLYDTDGQQSIDNAINNIFDYINDQNTTYYRLLKVDEVVTSEDYT